MHTSTKKLGGAESATETVLQLDRHTGDPDLVRIRDWWYMFVDYGKHGNYSIAYAQTTASDFPHGWEFKGKVLGPYTGKQTWDNPTATGNSFGVGDADVILADGTLYMFYERPVGVAYRDLG